MKSLTFYSLIWVITQIFSAPNPSQASLNVKAVGNRLTLQSFVITKEKDITINGRDAVSFVAMQYSSCGSTHTPLTLQDIKKVTRKDIKDKKSHTVNVDISQNFSSGQKVAFTLYERDLCSCQQSWTYECSKTMYYASRTIGYGSVIINFSDFSSSTTRTYTLPEGSITVKLQ